VKLEDLEAPLTLDVESVKDMFAKAGLTWKEGVPPDKQENLLIKPHFVMVYTSPAKAARQLGARLESVWTWNVRFLRMLRIPARRPPSKLEIFYFWDAQRVSVLLDEDGGPRSRWACWGTTGPTSNDHTSSRWRRGRLPPRDSRPPTRAGRPGGAGAEQSGALGGVSESGGDPARNRPPHSLQRRPLPTERPRAREQRADLVDRRPRP